MSIYKHNRHDRWRSYCSERADDIAAIGLSESITSHEHRFIEFVTDGVDAAQSLSLYDLDDERFWRLFRFALDYFDRRMIDFTAMERRRVGGSV